MGQVLSLLGLAPGAGGRMLVLRDDGPPASPTAADAYESAQRALRQSRRSLQYLESYRGNEALVKRVIESTDPDVRAEALDAMLPNIEAIRGFYELSRDMESATASILGVAVSEAAGDVTAVAPELSTKLAQVLEAVFLLDWAKMSHPAVQNDFSFYRREQAKQRGAHARDSRERGGDGGGGGVRARAPVSDAEASSISIFVAQGSPLLTALGAALAPQARKDPRLPALLADLAAVESATLLRGGGPADPGARQTLVLSMVEAVVLFDALHPAGAFGKGSPVDVRRVVAAVRQWDSDLRPAALSTLQFSSRTFKKSSGSVQRLFLA